jgi:hypothetical protein
MLANTSSIDIQQDLATHAAAIRDLGKRTVEQVIEIGQRLTVCKKLVGHVIVGQTTPVIRGCGRRQAPFRS